MINTPYKGPSGVGPNAAQQDLGRVRGFEDAFLFSVWTNIEWCWSNGVEVDDDWAQMVKSEADRRRRIALEKERQAC